MYTQSLFDALHRDLLDQFQKEQIEDVNEAMVRQKSSVWFKSQSYLLPKETQTEIIEQALYAIVGLGPLEFFLRDSSVSEIMVNGAENIFVERLGVVQKTDRTFLNNDHVIRVINKIVGTIGRRIDQKNPLVDARLLDGSRVNAVIEPLSLCGPVLTIRKFPEKVFSFDDIIEYGSANEAMKIYITEAIKDKKNILISGGTGAGKTSTLNACSAMISDGERIITIEDVAEIRIDHPHHIALETRAENIEGEGAISIRALLKNALRMRPDRIIVGEIRGEEVIDMLQAMNTGHQGSLTTVHANAPLESLYRLETMVLMGGDVPLQSVRPQIVQAIDVVIQQNRMPDGSRKITYISEVNKHSTEGLSVKDIFLWKNDQFCDERVL